MKQAMYLLFAICLISSCKKSSSKPGSNNSDYAAAALSAGTYQISSTTDANGNLQVYTSQNSPGTIVVSKTDDTHFSATFSINNNGTPVISTHVYVFANISGDGYVHFTENNNSSTAEYVHGTRGDTFSVDITATPNDIRIVSIK